MSFCRRKKKPKPVPKPTPGPPVPVPVPTPTPSPKPPPIPKPPPPPPVPDITIQVVNRSSHVTDAQGQAFADALQTQVTRDYLPLWAPTTKVKITFAGAKQAADPSAWQLLLLENSDQAGALGYHDVTPQGLPLGKVFVATDIQYGYAWTVTGSHEGLEMLGDPNINLEVTDTQTGWKYAYENCDAVENNTYVINGVEMSDFVTKDWFTSKPLGFKFDFLKVLTGPFKLAPGGYISVDKGNGWTQIFGRLGAFFHGYEARPKVGSRRERRGVPKSNWLRSSS